MIPLSKCLGTPYLFGILYALTVTLCECKPDFGLDGVIGGTGTHPADQGVVDNIVSSDLVDNTDPSNFNEQSETAKRDWSKFNSWGKRFINDGDNGWDKDKRKWQNFNSWGKRSDLNEVYIPRHLVQRSGNGGQWSSFSSWGKRHGSDDTAGVDLLDKKSKEEFQGPLAVDKRKWSKFTSWGKRESDLDTDKRKWSQFNSWGKRSDENEIDKRKWSQFNSWGKRDVGDDLTGAVKRKWNKFTTWGKRDQLGDNELPDKRKWSKFTSWGKRDSSDIEADKRKWSNFNSWGKRGDKWSNFTPWGKRDDDDDYEIGAADKRKWNQFASWGKRGDGDQSELEPSKRQWSGFTSWGKRSPGEYEDLESDLTADKRGWSQFSSWRKRLRNARSRNWNTMGNWGKRRWAGLVTWGKRSGSPAGGMSTDSIVLKLLQYFDKDGDEVLGKEELHNYISTLMAIPSSQTAKLMK